jgi:hypothetical protein
MPITRSHGSTHAIQSTCLSLKSYGEVINNNLADKSVHNDRKRVETIKRLPYPESAVYVHSALETYQLFLNSECCQSTFSRISSPLSFWILQSHQTSNTHERSCCSVVRPIVNNLQQCRKPLCTVLSVRCINIQRSTRYQHN